MSLQILRDLRGLRILVIYAPDSEGKALVEQLNRIGCTCQTSWPIPEVINANIDVVFVAADPENRAQILKLCASTPTPPTLIAITAYEDPGTLQAVLECGALAVVERPVKPFGLLSNLTIARSLWIERQAATKRIRKLERKIAGNNKIAKAKSIIMETQKVSEFDAYETIRQKAMSKRIPMDELANSIINAHELLTTRLKDDKS